MIDSNLREEVFRLHAHLCEGLADPIRILILYTLTEHHHNVTELAEALNLPQPTISRHLKVLRDRNMVLPERSGQSVYYRLADPRVIEALDLLRSMLADMLQNQIALARTVSNEFQHTGGLS